jgi:lysophospholipase L1-like esterase
VIRTSRRILRYLLLLSLFSGMALANSELFRIIKIEQDATDTWALTFESTRDATYQIQSASSPDGPWCDTGQGFPGGEGNSTVVKGLTDQANRCFWRVARIGPVPIKRIAFLGDSITGYGFWTGSPMVYSASGFWDLMRIACHGRFDFIRRPGIYQKPTWSFGGRTSVDLLKDSDARAPGANHVAEVLAECTGTADAVFVFAGANDMGRGTSPNYTYTPAQVVANIVALWDAVRAAGKQVIGAQMVGRGDNFRAADRATVNASLVMEAAARGMPLVTWGDVIEDENPYDFKYTVPIDLVHPKVTGQMKMGAHAATIVAPYLQPYSERGIRDCSSKRKAFPGTDDNLQGDLRRR